MNLEKPRSGLQEDWGIRSRGQLLGRVHWLLREGHRVGFAEEIGEWSSLDDFEVARLQAWLRKNVDDDSKEQAWRLQQVRANARDEIRGVGSRARRDVLPRRVLARLAQ